MEKIPWHEKKEFGFALPFCCWESELPKFIFPHHWHECYELILVLDGKVDVVIDGYALEAFRNDIVSINPGQMHGFPNSENGTRLRFFQFETGVFSKDVGVVPGEALFFRKPVLRGDGYPKQDEPDEALYTQVYRLLAALFTEYREQKTGYRLAIKAILYQIALVYLRNSPPETNGPLKIPLPVVKRHTSWVTEQRMERVYQLIFKNFDHIDLDLDKAAEAAALSPSYFARLFKEQIGRSFYDYLTTVRVSHAKEFLLTTDLPLCLIADKCGFASQSTFHRVFKAETSCTPAVYRKSVKQY
jgi:AraC-like DNA-binding protein